jgi:Family of unknown function (DUF6448)
VSFEDHLEQRGREMKKALLVSVLAGGLLFGAQNASAHCDALDGPVAAAALEALEAQNVNLVLPYAPASAEAELSAAFEQAVAARASGPAGKAVADRYFVETAVRLHRAGEGAPYTGVQPAGMDFGPAIPAAERALETGDAKALEALLTEEVRHAIRERLAEAMAKGSASKEPKTHAEVAAARERVSAEFAFIGLTEEIHRATEGAGHSE